MSLFARIWTDKRYRTRLSIGGRPRLLRRGPLSLELLEDRTLLDSTLESISQPVTGGGGAGITAGNGASALASVSPDGRFVAYASEAGNLAANQVSTVRGGLNVFRYDRTTGANTLVSHRANAVAPITGNSSFVDRDLLTLAPPPVLSADGGVIAYDSDATDLVSGLVVDPTTPVLGEHAVFVWDLQSNSSRLVSHAFGSLTTEALGNFLVQGISDNGRYILFQSVFAVPGLVQNETDSGTGTTARQEYLYDRTDASVRLISHVGGQLNVDGSGDSNQAVISSDGSTVVFTSTALDLVAGATGDPGEQNVYLYKVATQQVSLVSGVQGSATRAAGGAHSPSLSGNGGVVAFVCDGVNLVNGSTTPTPNVYRFSGGTVSLVSHAARQPTVPGNDLSDLPVISADGAVIAFKTQATNLVGGQTGTNGVVLNYPGTDFRPGNIFLFSVSQSALTLVTGVTDGNGNRSTTNAAGSVPLDEGNPDRPNMTMSLSADGSRLVYQSEAINLVRNQRPPDGVGPGVVDQVFVYTAAGTTLASGLDGSPTDTGFSSSTFPTVSRAGSALVYLSGEMNLNHNVGVANGSFNLWLVDLVAGPLPVLVSHSAQPVTGAGAESVVAGISGDGKLVVLTSTATNLVAGEADDNTTDDVFLRDRRTNTTAVVSHVPGAPLQTGFRTSQQPVISSDGRFIAFVSLADDLVSGFTSSDPRASESIPRTARLTSNLFLYEVATGTVTLVTHVSRSDPTSLVTGANGVSSNPAISADGRYTLYTSAASNLVSGQMQTNGVNVYLYDRVTNSSVLVSHAVGRPTVTGNGNSNDQPALSGDGRFVAYAYARDGSSGLVAGQTTASSDVYLYDRTTGVNALVSHANGQPAAGSNGPSTQPVISSDGSTVAFVSRATNLVAGQTGSRFSNVFVYAVPNGAVTLVSGAAGSASTTGNNDSDQPALSADGGFVAYRSAAGNLVAGEGAPVGHNVYEYSRQTGTNALVSVAIGFPGVPANGDSASPTIDGDGSLVAYQSDARNLVVGEAGPAGPLNVFVWQRATGGNLLASGQGGSDTVTGNNSSFGPLLSQHSISAFSSMANDLVAGVVGTTNAFDNTIFRINVSLAPVALADGTPAGTVVATFTFTVLAGPKGQFAPPAITLDPSMPDGQAFSVSEPTAGDPTHGQLTTVVAINGATKNMYSILVDVDLHLGDSLASPFTLTVALPLPSVSLTALPNPATSGQSITFTATVSAPSGPPAGSVQFLDGPTGAEVPLGGSGPVNLVNGVATLVLSNLGVATHPVSAAYSGPGFQPARSPVVLLAVTAPATGPTATISPVSTPRTTPAGVVTINFSVAVTGVTLAGLSLIRDGSNVSLAGLTVTQVTPSQYTLDLSSVSGTPGNYVLTLLANSGIRDGSGNPLSANASTTFQETRTSTPAKTQVAAIDPARGVWYLNTASGVVNFPYGLPGWLPVSGDWTGTGRTQVGAIDPGTFTWYLNTAGGVVHFPYGLPGWKPVTGDWTGTGKTQVGAVDPTTNIWYLNTASGVVHFPFGAPGWIPVSGDWTGTGKTQVGVVDPGTSTWYLNTPGGVVSFQYGLPGWKPVTGDWTGTGKTQVGAVDPTTNIWYLNTPGGVAQFPYGTPGWTPISGAWTGSNSKAAVNRVRADAVATMLTGDELQGVVSAVLARLSAAGVDAALVQRLASAEYRVGALPGPDVAQADPLDNRVTFSPDAAGHGWLVPGVAPEDAAPAPEDLRAAVVQAMGQLAGGIDSNGRGSDVLDAIFTSGL
jgi:Tol biopolymer transport system component